MKIENIILILIFILAGHSFSTAQIFDLSDLLKETLKTDRITVYQSYSEFTSNSRHTFETENGKKVTKEYENVCSLKRCVGIIVSENGKRFSDKKIRNNREKAAKQLIKAEKDNKTYVTKEETIYGYSYGFSSIISPSLYLQKCKTELVDKIILENRRTIKVGVSDCNISDLDAPTDFVKNSLQFMTKTKGFIWIDEQDKAIVRVELYARKEFENSANNQKPLVIIEYLRVPEGFWFWKYAKINALANRDLFPEYDRSWKSEYFDYRSSNVEIKAEIDKK